jgi:hypothetical protein
VIYQGISLLKRADLSSAMAYEQYFYHRSKLQSMLTFTNGSIKSSKIKEFLKFTT